MGSKYARLSRRPVGVLMPFVLDCSMAMAWVIPDGASEATGRLRDSLFDDRAFVPSLWPVEVGSVLLAAAWRAASTLTNGRTSAPVWRPCRSRSKRFPCREFGVRLSLLPAATTRLTTMLLISNSRYA